MTGQQLYRNYRYFALRTVTALQTWEQLSEDMREVWNRLARLVEN